MRKLIIILSIAIAMIAMVFVCLKPKTEVIHEAGNNQKAHEQQDGNTASANEGVIQVQSNPQDLQIMKPIEMNMLSSHQQLPENYKDTPENYVFSFDHVVMNTKKVDDHLPIQMLQFGLNREGVIQSKDILDDGIVRWKGRFEGYPEDINYFTITQAEQDHYAVMKVFTDKGAFVAEIKNGIGLATPVGEGVGHDEHDHDHGRH